MRNEFLGQTGYIRRPDAKQAIYDGYTASTLEACQARWDEAEQERLKADTERRTHDLRTAFVAAGGTDAEFESQREKLVTDARASEAAANAAVLERQARASQGSMYRDF